LKKGEDEKKVLEKVSWRKEKGEIKKRRFSRSASSRNSPD
jgi:hypothetical protein